MGDHDGYDSAAVKEERVPRVSTRARVLVTLEIDLPSTWGTDCKVDQIYMQATREARELLRHSFHLGDGLKMACCVQHANARIIGEPKVSSIITEDKR